MARITRIEAWACRSLVETPVATSFGIMRDRPAVFIRIEDSDGAFGWGEAFANWPAAGAEHRVNLLMEDVAPLVLGAEAEPPEQMFARLTTTCHVRALQCGEFGPFRQVVAALDIAAWDLAARRRDLPVRRLLRDDAPDRVPAYASGIHVNGAETVIGRMRGQGFRAFKVKVGFDLERDARAVVALSRGLAGGERLFTDANQAWSREGAADFLARTECCALGWLEEPMPADAPAADWSELAAATPTPLAGGENIAGAPEFAAAIEQGALAVLQPDIAKWGGFTGCLAVARAALAAGRLYCPHFLGGGIGLAASAHLLAAAGGGGLLEVDVNPNPLRDAFGPVAERVGAGTWHIAPGAGLGITSLPRELGETVTLHREVSA